METLFFVISLLGVLGVLHWAVTNDAAGNRGATKGFFAMCDDFPERRKPPGRPGHAP